MPANSCTHRAAALPAEERFERFRQRAGLVLAPLVFLALWLAPLSGSLKRRIVCSPSWAPS
jgi:hypothetical protein